MWGRAVALTAKELNQLLLAKLAASGLSEKDAEDLKITAYTKEEMLSTFLGKLPTDCPAAGFTIPYYNLQREWTGFYRYRYLEQPVLNGFAALTKHKEYRYIQPAKMPPRAYFSLLYDWESYFKESPAKRWLILTEGELKANAACKRGFPTVGLGGVWNFRSGKTSAELIADIKDLPLEKSIVYIAFDSDSISNPNVLQAENALARELLKLKAHPYIVRIPPLKALPKTGLDDYLMAKGEKGVQKIIEKAEEWTASRALFEMNEDVIFLRSSDVVLELSTRHRWRVSEFTNGVYANRSFLATEITAGKTVQKEKRTAQEWIRWPGRSEVEGVTYQPGEPVAVGKEFNVWRGWGIDEALVKPGPIKLWNQLLDFAFAGGKPEYRRWFEQWLAYPIQHPGTKLFQCVVVWGPSGVGKTLIGHTMGRIYGSNYTEVNERELHGNFNEWAEYKQFALGDEITGGDKRAVADYLKGIITQKFLRINPKYIKPYVIPDCINWYFTSNHPDAFFVEDDDRRYFVWEIKGPPLPQSFYSEYDHWYRGDGVGALFYHFLKLSLEGFDPHARAPITPAKREMIADTRSELGGWVACLREEPTMVLNFQGEDLTHRKLWTTTELHALFDPAGNKRVTLNGLCRELKRMGFRRALDGLPVRTLAGLQKLWVLDPTVAEIRAPAKLAAIFNQERGLEVNSNGTGKGRKKQHEEK